MKRGRNGWLRAPAALASLVAAAGLAITALATLAYHDALRREAVDSLQRSADRFELIVESQLESCGNLVRAIQLVLHHQPEMSPSEFDERIGALRAQRSFPSLQAVAYARREVDAGGVEHYPTRLVAPALGNESLWDLDVTRQPDNLRTLKRALDSDEPAMSKPFRLIQHPSPGDLQDGVVIRLPVLSTGPVAVNAIQRRERELGSITVSFRISALLDRLIRSLDRELRYELVLTPESDGSGPMIYSTAVAGLSAAGDRRLASARAQVDYGGQVWQLELLPHPTWFASSWRDPATFAAIGAFASLLMAALVWSLAGTRQQAQRLAERLAARAQQSDDRFEQLSHLLPVAAVLARADDGHIEYVNDAGRRLLGIHPDDRELSLADFGLAGALPTASECIDPVLADPMDSAIPVSSPDGRQFHASVSEARVAVDGEDKRLLVVADVTERLQLTAQLRHQASHDALTGLLNRRAFDLQLQRAVAGREPRFAHAALFYMDLDQFKLINDTCGHQAGDQLLARVAAQVLETVAGHGLVARLGGDEFGVLASVDALAGARGFGERLRGAVDAIEFVWEGRSFQLTASIGAVALGIDSTRPAGELLAIADTTCYLAKEAGRNRVVVHDENEDASRLRRSEMDWVQRIRRALAEGRLCLHYQELRALGAVEMHGAHFELLVRMRDEHGELVPPGAFIPAAERFGVMPAVDRWVVQSALRHFNQLHPQGADIGLCAINLSGATMGDDSFPGFLLDQLRRSGVPPEKLCFEITETSAVANFDQAAALIVELRDLGCKVALDDFGAGMSSFAYLKNLPVDYLKIDGSFIREIETDPLSRSIVRAVTEIGHQFGTRVIAEFVNGERACHLLAGIGVDFAQGFGIHVPEPVRIDLSAAVGS